MLVLSSAPAPTTDMQRVVLIATFGPWLLPTAVLCDALVAAGENVSKCMCISMGTPLLQQVIWCVVGNRKSSNLSCIYEPTMHIIQLVLLH